jgi:hypothetical protein
MKLTHEAKVRDFVVTWVMVQMSELPDLHGPISVQAKTDRASSPTLGEHLEVLPVV